MNFAVELNTRAYGKADQPAVVLLHGMFGSASNLQGIARVLSEHFYVLAADLRNHGDSPHRDDMSLPLMAMDVERLLESKGLDNAHILGHSLGGKVAMEFAIRNPSAVNKLVIADIGPSRHAAGHDAVFAALADLDIRSVKSRQEAAGAMAKHLDSEMLIGFLLKNLARNDSGGWKWKMNLDAIEDNYVEFLGAVTQGEFSGPALFVRGELSDYVPDSERGTINRYFPNASIETIADAGHWLHAEKPSAFNHIVDSFLRA